MAGRYGRKFMKDENFDEGEVWGGGVKEKNILCLSPSSSSATRPRMIPRSSSSSSSPSQNKQFSAPLDIPDWSKVYGKNSKKKGNYNFAPNSSSSSSSSWGFNDGGGDGDGDDDEDEDGVVPPHEYLARKLARSQISSFSMYEGIGRTLKGRDLSKVRNAILTKTGFLES